MVLKFSEELTHSYWCDFTHRCRTHNGLQKMLKRGIKQGQWIGFRLIEIQQEEIGVV